jgi:hypothetical protein
MQVAMKPQLKVKESSIDHGTILNLEGLGGGYYRGDSWPISMILAFIIPGEYIAS